MQNYSIKQGGFYLHHDALSHRLDAKQLALAANISIKTAYKWINGKQKPEPAKVELMVYKVLGVLPNAPEYRLIKGHIHHTSIKKPLPLTAWAALDSLYQLNSLNQQQVLETDDKITALKRENAQLKARLYELSLALVAPRDNENTDYAVKVAPRDTSVLTPTPLQ